jgi:alpha-galactosidase
MTGERITIDAGATVLVLGVADDGRLHQLGFGGPGVLDEGAAFPVALYPLAYPTFGEEPLREPALRVTHADGATSTRLVVRAVADEAEGEGRHHRIDLGDRVAPLAVALHLRTWPEAGIIEQWVEVANEGDAPCALHQAASCAPALAGTDPYLTHWGGGWAHEWTETTEPIAFGTKVVGSAGGVRPSLHRAPVVLYAPEGRAEEEAGTVVAATVAWGGDCRFDVEMAMHRHCRLIAGTQHRGAERTLEPGQRFATPSALLVWSDAGVGPTSRALHAHVRRHVVRDGGRDRAIVANNWEAMGFDLGDEGLARLVDASAEVGAELFLLDDGWFGDRHPRDDDTQGLGDWVVDRAKLPHGLAPTIERAMARGLRFGLWVEPEMVNPRSELAEAHPDWAIGEPGREAREERQQLVLDLCRPEVAEFVVGTIDRLLAEHPQISYLKWDANRDLTEPGSRALPADRQSHLPIDRVRATEAVMAEVARRHPDVELMLCASGGGRSDLATLRWFHELWTSDDTDPVDRVRIQWGASHLLPANVLGAHVTRWGAKPVAFGCAVAMSARFGFDLPLADLADDELAAARAAVAGYRRLRPLVQRGDLHRLVSPVGSPVAALAYLDPTGVGADRAAVFAYRLEAGDPPVAVVAVPGLEPDETYVVEDLTPGSPSAGAVRRLRGGDLAAGALGWPAGPAPAAAVWAVSPAG